MKITSQWLEKRCFVAANEHGNSIVMDGTPASEGLKRGASPMEVLLMGAAGCSSIDVIGALQEQQQDVLDCITTVEGERAETSPRYFTQIHLHFKVVGRNLQPELVAKAVQESADKYCSACATLGKAAKMSYSHEIVIG
ncbi:OsmC family protein [Kingella negevensis]|uniref:OsmC family protein n=1 Tax=Kingella negevensis TaxID=1522312 RepID=UPI00050A123E|nr:OsmC family protein [Kingella negevensis]MDK4679821.1 OsmC family protein [Kingella negevensis]MDK4682460.1 OsmC family protein [Kingella negevensis]MDK4688854.1 OsmC family protein [Kingella negevensis]MDK4690657.1 OsmC family protein [Kingella negevensis]MDK4691994.1 OsmC family protein [Kingella negevensis]